MADSHSHIDLTTLQEVERLLTSTNFASIDDLAARGMTATKAPVAPASAAGRNAELVTGAAPLPKRR